MKQFVALYKYLVGRDFYVEGLRYQAKDICIIKSETDGFHIWIYMPYYLMSMNLDDNWPIRNTFLPKVREKVSKIIKIYFGIIGCRIYFCYYDSYFITKAKQDFYERNLLNFPLKLTHEETIVYAQSYSLYDEAKRNREAKRALSQNLSLPHPDTTTNQQ
jgi:hypothetical protein